MVEAKIRTKSVRLRQDLIIKIPNAPAFTDILFCADGIASPDEEKDKGRFVRKCSERKIIPYQRGVFKFDYKTRLFLLDDYDSRWRCGGYASDGLSHAILKNSIEGGRPQQIRLVIPSSGDAEHGKDIFNREKQDGGWLDLLLTNGYVPMEGILGFEDRRRANREESSNWEGIEIRERFVQMTMNLSRSYGCDSSPRDERREVANWFKALAARYEKK